MGKSGDLWDDCALINAFDHAMDTYKAMHSKTYRDDSPEEEKHMSGNNENNHAFTEKTTGYLLPEDNSSDLSNNAMETCVPGYNTEATTEGFPIQENNLGTDLHATEPHTNSSGLPCIDGKTNYYADQSSVDYNYLLRQYHEIEEQKQKVVEQLHQAGFSNIQIPVRCSTCQALQAPTFDPSGHGLHPACSLCSCCCLAAPLIPVSACAISGLSPGGHGGCPACTAYCPASQAHQYPGHQYPSEIGTCPIATSCMLDPEKQSTRTDDNSVKIGMRAAEQAISSMQMGISASSNICDGKEKAKDKEDGSGIYGGIGSQGISSETDLAAVLSAWYAAGFHTGRYLSEQSKRNTFQ